MVTPLGSLFGPAAVRKRSSGVPFLIWAQYLTSTGHGPGDAIWLNLDETALPLVFGGRHGNVHHLKHNAAIHLATPATLAQRRAHCTLVAAVSNTEALQKHLPQVLLPNTKGKKKIWTAAERALPPDSTIRIIPDTQGWVNTRKLIRILDYLHEACRAHDPTKKYVLVWDCHPTHIAPAVLRHARRRDFTILLVPSKLTHLLQVLDFAVFATLKQELHRAHLAHFVTARNAHMPLQQWIDVTIACIKDKMSRVSAANAFHSAGQPQQTAPYRAAVQRWLPERWRPTSRQLTEAELWFLIGRKQRNIHRLLFPRRRGGAPPLPPPADPPLKRLRSKTTL